MCTVDLAVIFSSFSEWYGENRTVIDEDLSIISNALNILVIVYSVIATLIGYFLSRKTDSPEERNSLLKKYIPAAITIFLVLFCAVAAVNCGVPSESCTSQGGTTTTTSTTTTTTTATTTTSTTSTTKPTTTTTTKDDSPFANIRVGGTVKFGEYYTSGSRTSPIAWRVLDIDRSEGVALLITEQAIDAKSFDKSHSNVTWKHSGLRDWLNDDFYYEAFSDSDRDYIQLSTIYTFDYSNVKYYTEDHVFCLSEGEAYDYLNDNSRQAAPTPYAISQGVTEGTTTGNCCWWLRSAGDDLKADCVDFWGKLMVGGTDVNYNDKGVRPAIYVYI